MSVILYQPQIPQNTGNIVRTCSVTGFNLYLVPPMGFSVNDRWLKRAGLDYWSEVSIETVEDFEQLLESTTHNFYFFSSHAKKSYTDVAYNRDDWLIFGSETEGLPDWCRERWPERFVTLPMLPEARCLNLATSAGIAMYELLRQQNFSFIPSSNQI